MGKKCGQLGSLVRDLEGNLGKMFVDANKAPRGGSFRVVSVTLRIHGESKPPLVNSSVKIKYNTYTVLKQHSRELNKAHGHL